MRMDAPSARENARNNNMTDASAIKNKTGPLPLLHWLLQRHPETPKTRAKQWILAGRVSVKGVVIAKPHQIMADPGDTLELLGRRATTLDCGNGWQIHPRVALLYLDSAFAIVNKGPGLISVPAPNCDLSALSILADFLAGRLKAQDRGVAGKTLPPAYRRLEPSPVHRLDQYTSGVFCIAMNPVARGHLIEQLKAHSMRREYVAFVEGRTPVRSGTWRQWLDLSDDELRQHIVPEPKKVGRVRPGEPLEGEKVGRVRPGEPLEGEKVGRVRPGEPLEAKEAITHYEVIAEYLLPGEAGFVTKLRLRLETGRKHQIRVQAAHAGLPLIGDRVYNPNYRGVARAGHSLDFDRQALHAEVLSLEHPDQPGVRMSWTAKFPKDLLHLEATLKAARR